MAAHAAAAWRLAASHPWCLAALAAAGTRPRECRCESGGATARDRLRLRALVAGGGLTHPSGGAPASFAHLAQALAMCCGQSPAPPRREAEAIASELLGPSGTRRHLVFVLCDGMGSAALERHLEPGSFLRRWNDPTRLVAVFPSTTPAALTTLATGVWPGQHGMPGWDLRDQKNCEFPRLPEQPVQLTVLYPFVVDKRSGKPAAELGFSEEDLYVARPWSSLGEMSRRTLFVSAYSGTDFTKWYLGPLAKSAASIPEIAIDTIGAPGTSETAVDFFRKGCDAALEAVRQAEREGFESYIYIYTAHPDNFMHLLGVEHDEVGRVMRGFDQELARLWEGLRQVDAALLVTADHGHVTVRPEDMVTLPPEMLACLEYANVGVHGPGRHAYFHCRSGRQAEFEALWAQQPRLSKEFLLLSVEDASAEGLFGPDAPLPAVRPRLGDIVAVSLGAATLVSPPEADRWRDGPCAACQGAHGSLTPEEMRIPYVLLTPEPCGAR